MTTRPVAAKMFDMSQWILYGRPDCHLCEEADALLHRVAGDIGVRHHDIEADLDLIRRYGDRVPVLRRQDTGAELNWPFDVTELRAFIEHR